MSANKLWHDTFREQTQLEVSLV